MPTFAVARPDSMQDRPANVPRLFVPAPLSERTVPIEERDAHYLGHVLRLKTGDRIVVFDGRGTERVATIETLARRGATLSLGEHTRPLPESPLAITLVQALLKNDAMDFVIQKATELGVREIRAVKTDFSVIKLDESRSARRVEHWQRIARSACEQSGRHTPPSFDCYSRLDDCLEGLPATALRIAFDPEAAADLGDLAPPDSGVCLLAGPEGGFSATDHRLIEAAGFSRIRLGPRTLRAETASISACALAQYQWGDLR